MPKIIPLIEGQGEIEAVPTLLYKILHDLQEWQWQVGKPYRVNSLGRLKKYLASLLRKASNRKDCDALLILLDLDDGCAVETAKQLAEDIQKLYLAQPVAIVFAIREYEAWFLASLPTIVGPLLPISSAPAPITPNRSRSAMVAIMGCLSKYCCIVDHRHSGHDASDGWKGPKWKKYTRNCGCSPNIHKQTNLYPRAADIYSHTDQYGRAADIYKHTNRYTRTTYIDSHTD